MPALQEISTGDRRLLGKIAGLNDVECDLAQALVAVLGAAPEYAECLDGAEPVARHQPAERLTDFLARVDGSLQFGLNLSRAGRDRGVQ